MRPEHYQDTPFVVRVPRGNDGFWDIICKLHRQQGTFTVAEIDDASNVSVKCITKYIRLLIAGGFAERIGGKQPKFQQDRYRLLKSPARAPRVRPDGSDIPATKQEHIWTAIRTLKTFGVREVAYAATTPEAKPGYDLTKRYIGWLTTAGYLVVVRKVVGNKPQIWRLKPHMDTGPKPPRLTTFHAKAMFDPNLKQFVGAPPTAKETRL